MRTLFKQNPKVKKYKPRPLTRQVASIDLDRKGELEKFRKWLEWVGKEKSNFPEKDEVAKISKDAKSARASGLAMLGILAAIPAITPMLGNLGLGNIGNGIKDFTSGLKIPGLPGIPGAPGGDGADRTGGPPIPGGTGAMIGATAKKLFGGNRRQTGQTRGTTAQPGTRPIVGGNRPFMRGGSNTGLDYRRGTDPTTGRQLRSNASISRYNASDARVRAGQGNLGDRARLLNRGKNATRMKEMFKSFFSKALKTKFGLKKIAEIIRPIVKKIPFIGALIDFALNVFVFKENIGRAAFKAIGSGLGLWLGGGVGSVLGAGFASWITGPIGAYLGATGGDMLGGWIYDQVFNDGSRSSVPSVQTSGDTLEDVMPAPDAEESSPAPPPQNTTSKNTEKDNITTATHQETGSGYTVKGLLDYKGRPVIFSRAAAGAFYRMMRDSRGVVKGSDIHSSQRSKAFNASLPGAAPNSNHLYGNAVDIHGASQSWMRKHGRKYGWIINDYPGSHGGHFNFKGGGAPPSEVDVPQDQRTSSATPVTSGVRQDISVAMLSPQAEAMNSGVTIC